MSPHEHCSSRLSMQLRLPRLRPLRWKHYGWPQQRRCRGLDSQASSRATFGAMEAQTAESPWESPPQLGHEEPWASGFWPETEQTMSCSLRPPTPFLEQMLVAASDTSLRWRLRRAREYRDHALTRGLSLASAEHQICGAAAANDDCFESRTLDANAAERWRAAMQ